MPGELRLSAHRCFVKFFFCKSYAVYCKKLGNLEVCGSYNCTLILS